MARPVGATYGDAIIVALDFARDDPIRFLLTIPVCLVIVAVVGAVWYRYVVGLYLRRKQRAYSELLPPEIQRPPESRP